MDLNIKFMSSSPIIQLKNRPLFCLKTVSRRFKDSVKITLSRKPTPSSDSEAKDKVGSCELYIASFIEDHIALACFSILSAPYFTVQWLRYFKESTCKHIKTVTQIQHAEDTLIRQRSKYWRIKISHNFIKLILIPTLADWSEEESFSRSNGMAKGSKREVEENAACIMWERERFGNCQIKHFQLWS